MAAGAPTGALAQKLGVRLKSDIDLALGTLHLRMAFETKVASLSTSSFRFIEPCGL